MLGRVALLGALAFSSLASQAPARTGYHLGLRLPIGRETRATSAACDNSGFQAIEGKKKLGKTLAWGGAIAAAGGAYAAQSANYNANALTVTVLGLGTAFAGAYIVGSVDAPEAMDKALQSLKIGETRSADVAICMGRPSSTTTRNVSEETWTYTVMKSQTTGGVVGMFLPFIPHGGSTEMRSVSLTFKNGVLSDVSKTAGAF